MAFGTLAFCIVLGVAVLLGSVYFYYTYKDRRCYSDAEVTNR